MSHSGKSPAESALDSADPRQLRAQAKRHTMSLEHARSNKMQGASSLPDGEVTRKPAFERRR
jgi:hypothetical protein